MRSFLLWVACVVGCWLFVTVGLPALSAVLEWLAAHPRVMAWLWLLLLGTLVWCVIRWGSHILD